MERLQALKVIVYMAAVLLVVELGMLVLMIRPTSFFLWGTLAVIAIICTYLIRLSLGLLAELKEREQNNNPK